MTNGGDDNIIIGGHKANGNLQTPPNYVPLGDVLEAINTLNAGSSSDRIVAVALQSAYDWVTG